MSRMMQKIRCCVVAVAAVFLGTGAWAEPVARIGETTYETLEEAIDAAKNGDTVQLVKDVTLSAALRIDNKALEVDLGGHTITGQFGFKLGQNGAYSASMKNGTVQRNGWGPVYVWEEKSGSTKCTVLLENLSINYTGTTVFTDKTDGSVYMGANDGLLEVTFRNVSVNDRICVCGLAGKATAIVESVDSTYTAREPFYSSATLKVRGGTYAQDVTSFVDTGYECVRLENGKYVVQEKVLAKLEDLTTDASGAYLIATVEDLITFRDLVNQGTDFKNKVVKQTANLDLSAVDNFVSIGSQGKGKSFKGTYDGQGYTISNLKCVSAVSGVGLFGKADGAIRNVTVSNGSVRGTDVLYVGGIVGHGYATIENCRFEGTVVGGQQVGGISGSFCGKEIKNCNFIGSVTGLTAVGGIAGRLQEGADVISSYVSGSVAASVSTQMDHVYAGGLVGDVVNQTSSYVSKNFVDATIKVNGEDVANPVIGVYYNPISESDLSSEAVLSLQSNGWNTEMSTAAALDIVSISDGADASIKAPVVLNNAVVVQQDASGAYTVSLAVAQIGETKYETLDAAFAASKSCDTIKLLADVENIGAVTLKDGVTFDGDGKKITGASALYCGPTSTTVIENVVFVDIHNDSPISEEDRELYGFPEGAKGTQSAIYAQGFSTGSITITGCTFDDCDWDAIQIVPANQSTGTIVIRDNIFKHTDTAKNQLRHIHIQFIAKDVDPANPVPQSVNLNLTITDNQFFDNGKSANGKKIVSVGLYLIRGTAKLDGNYFEDKDAIDSGVFSVSRFYPMRSIADVDVDDLAFPLFNIGSTTYGTLAEAVAAANAATTAVTIKLNDDLTVDETVEINNANRKDVSFEGNGHQIVANTTMFKVSTGLNLYPCYAAGEQTGLVTCPNAAELFELNGGTLNIYSGIYTKDISSYLNQRFYTLIQNAEGNYVFTALNDTLALGKGLVAKFNSNGRYSYYPSLTALFAEKATADLIADAEEDVTASRAVTIRSANKTFAGSINVGRSNNASIYCDATLESVVCNQLNVGSFSYGVSTVTVKGGTVNALNVNATYGELIIQGGTFGVDPTAYLADGYEAVKTGDVWVVGKICVAQIGTTKYETFAEAIAAVQPGDVITVLNYNAETMVAPEDWKFVTTKGVTTLVRKVYVAQIGTTKYETFEAALAAANATTGATITLLADCAYSTNGTGLWNITKSMTIDGNGHSLSGWGTRSGNKTTLAINNGGSVMVDVVLKNLTINNAGAAGRPIETRGNISSLTLTDCVINATGSGNNQSLTIGGNQSSNANLTITRTTISAGAAGYPIMTFNPVTATINDSTFNGYCSFYFKAPNGSAGSFGTVVTAENTAFNAPNRYNGQGNGFGVFAMETDDITITLTNCSIDATAMGTANQKVVYEDSYSAKGNGVLVTIQGDDTVVKDALFNDSYRYNFDNSQIVIKGGSFDANAFNLTSTESSQVVVSGGKFERPVPENVCAPGFIPTANADGTYGVKAGAYVAQITRAGTTTKYETVAEALIAAESGDTIEILDGTWGEEAIGKLDETGSYTNANIVRYKSLTIQPAEGATVTFTSTLSLGYDDSSTANATMTVKNLKFDGASLQLSNYVQATVEGCRFVNGTKEKNGVLVVLDSCCKNHKTTGDYPTSQVTIKNCTINGSNDGASAIRIRNSGNVEITGCTIVNSKHNGILIESNGSVDNTPVKTIKTDGNTITEWNATNTADKGRAIRLDLGTLAEGSTVKVENNVFRKATLGLDAPDFAKITGVGAGSVSLEGNDWNDELRSTVSGNGAYYTTDAATPVVITQVVTTKKEPVAQIGETKYETVAAAVAAAKSGDTVKLLVDAEETQRIVVGKNITLTLDLNGKELTSSADVAVLLGEGSNLTISNGDLIAINNGIAANGINATATIATDAYVEVDREWVKGENHWVMNSNGKANTTFNVYGEAYCNGFPTIQLQSSNSTVNLDGAYVESWDWTAVYVNGSYSGNTVNIKDSEIWGWEAGVYVSNTYGAQFQTLNISGDTTISGQTAVEVKHTNVTIGEGVKLIQIYEDEPEFEDSNNSSCTYGWSFATTRNGPSDKPTGTITVTGGTYTGPFGIPSEITNADEVSVSVTGGIYDTNPSAYVATGYEAAARGTTPETWVVREESYEFNVPVEDEQTIPVAIPKEVFVNPVDKDGNPVDVSTPEKKLDYINSEAANGMKVWQNVAMGVDGSVAANVLEPVAGVATAAEKAGKTEPVVITTPVAAFNAPAPAATKVEVKYNLLKGVRNAEGRIEWAAQPVAVLDTPRFVVDVKDDTGDTFWKIEAVFTSVK